MSYFNEKIQNFLEGVLLNPFLYGKQLDIMSSDTQTAVSQL